MPVRDLNVSPNRRELLFRAVAGSGLLAYPALPAFGASDFWNKKPVSDWSVFEVEQLKIKSPWAKKVRSELASGRAERMDRPGSGKASLGGMSGADSNGLPTGGKTRGGQNSGSFDAPAAADGNQGREVVVCWESARPLIEATKLELPQPFENHHAVSVTGIPLNTLAQALNGGGADPEDPAARQKAAVDRLLAGTTLTAKGRTPVAADVMVQSRDRQSLIFAFLKPTLALTLDDKDVIFDMNLRTIRVKVKFELKEMMYKGALAV